MERRDIEKIVNEQFERDGGDSKGFITRRLLESRTVLLSGEIHDRSAQTVMSQLLFLEQESADKPVTFIINSGGGSISSGFAIFDMIRFLSAPLRTVGSGVVASMGVALFLSVPKERRFSFPNTRFMIHQPLISGTVVAPASDLEINAREMIKLKDHLNRLIAEATGQPLARVEKDTLRDYWMDANEALDYGLVGRIVKSRGELG